MENGHDGILADRLSGLALNNKNSNDSSNNSNNNNDNLFQVMKAVEAAEATIKQQVEENDHLRIELQRKIQELEKYRLMAQRTHGDTWKESVQSSSDSQQLAPSVNGVEDRPKSISNSSALNPSGTLVLHQNLKSDAVDASMPSRLESHPESSRNNGDLNVLAGGLMHTDNSGPSRFSSPSTTSASPIRYPLDGEYDQRFNLSGQGLMPMAELNGSNSLWKQDPVLKIREHEEEILQLRKHLSEYSIKEAQIRNEKYVLEKRIAYMRLAFDQQQQDLVDAASKALSYRQDIIEENIHLTYQLQAAREERTTFVQSLLPLLAEYSLQPPGLDAQSIVSNVKVLFKHLQEKLILTESKLKESQYQLTPWRSDLIQSNLPPQSPPHSNSAALVTSNNNGLELVPRQAYSHEKVPTASDAQAASDWDVLGDNQGGLSGVTRRNLDDDMRRFSHFASRK